MRAVVQRVKRASVHVDGEEVSRIGSGFLVLVGIGSADTKEDAEYLASKIAHLRAFEDREGKMNLSLKDVGGEALIISQFTLYGDCRRGRRPSFTDAMPSEKAEGLYSCLVERMRGEGVETRAGIFSAYMEVELVNDGPVTMLIDSAKAF